MSKTLPPPAAYGINSAQRVLEQGALVVRLEDYEQLQARVKELEAENAELRAEVYCNQMCVRFWPSHHSNCRLLAIRLNRIKQQAD